MGDLNILPDKLLLLIYNFEAYLYYTSRHNSFFFFLALKVGKNLNMLLRQPASFFPILQTFSILTLLCITMKFARCKKPNNAISCLMI